MQGNFIVELQKYVTDKFGEEAWKALLTNAGIKPNKIYFRLNSYPDEEIINILNSAAKLSAGSSTKLLEDFGMFLGEEFLRIYSGLVLPNWRTMDVIENSDVLMQEALKNLTSKAAPLKLSIKKGPQGEVHINYYSPRKMCMVGIGICKGVAKHFNEEIKVTHTSCMLEGDYECNMIIELVKKEANANV